MSIWLEKNTEKRFQRCGMQRGINRAGPKWVEGLEIRRGGDAKEKKIQKQR